MSPTTNRDNFLSHAAIIKMSPLRHQECFCCENYTHCQCHAQARARRSLPGESSIASSAFRIAPHWRVKTCHLNAAACEARRHAAECLELQPRLTTQQSWPPEPICLSLCTTEYDAAHSPSEGLAVDSTGVGKTASQLRSSFPIFSPFSF